LSLRSFKTKLFIILAVLR